jgi:hypothetical protein
MNLRFREQPRPAGDDSVAGSPVWEVSAVDWHDHLADGVQIHCDASAVAEVS